MLIRDLSRAYLIGLLATKNVVFGSYSSVLNLVAVLCGSNQ